jgi:hypothetical protein
MSDTPETDSQARLMTANLDGSQNLDSLSFPRESVPAELSRRLERNYNEARVERDEAVRSAQAWEESAAFHLRNEQFWRGLVMQIGEPFGVAAKTSDDGSIQEDVLGLKVPELVEKMRAENAKLKAAIGRLRGHIRGMDARVTMARVEIRERQAEVDQLEKEKWDLDREIDKIEKSIG